MTDPRGRHPDLQSTVKRGGLDRAQLPIELALDALDGADADMMLGGELANAGAALLQGVPDFALDGNREREWVFCTPCIFAGAAGLRLGRKP